MLTIREIEAGISILAAICLISAICIMRLSREYDEENEEYGLMAGPAIAVSLLFVVGIGTGFIALAMLMADWIIQG